jgi:ABC-type transporter Mla subunit MlaD
MKHLSRILILPVLLGVAGCSNSYKIHVFFDNVEGLKENSEVLANGMTIGEVDHMALDKKGVLVTLAIDSEHQIPNNSTLHFFERGLLADKQIEITTGTSNKVLKDGDTLKNIFIVPKQPTLSIHSLDTLVTKVAKIMAEENKPGKE